MSETGKEQQATTWHNLTSRIAEVAAQHPERPALILPQPDGRAQRVMYGALAQRASAFQRGLRAQGWRRGDRAIVMVPIGVELYALVWALVASGMVTVLIDPGMGLRNIIWAAQDCGARGVFTVPGLARWRRVLPVVRHLEVWAVDDALPRRMGASKASSPALEIEAVHPEEHALVTFTSGSTGRPKGADRTHRVLRAQHEALKAHFPNHTFEDPVDCTCFPVVAFHNLASGTVTALPPIDLRAPAEYAPEEMVAYLRAHRVTSLSGAPAFMRKLATYMARTEERLAHIGRILVGGGPVGPDLAEVVLRAFPHAHEEAWGVYGSTEAEPIAHVPLARMVSRSAQLPGFFVGAVVSETTARLLSLDAPRDGAALQTMGAIEAHTVTAPHRVGEVIVAGEHVVGKYLDNPEANRRHKLRPDAGPVWHRTGDTGRWDEEGALWLTGRVKDVVQTAAGAVEPFTVEREVNEWPEVARSALVSVPCGDQGSHAFLVVELERWESWPSVFEQARAWLDARGYGDVAPVRVPWLPVDRRHQTKLDRVTLRQYLTLHRVVCPHTDVHLKDPAAAG